MDNYIQMNPGNISAHCDLMDKFMEDRTSYNLFWMFYRTSSWFYVRESIRVMEVLITIELKKMIELSAAATILSKDEKQFSKIMKNVEENYFSTMVKKLDVNNIPSPLLKTYEYKSISYTAHVNVLSKDIIETYAKLNFIQHNSLIPSSQTNYIKEEITQTAIKVNKIIVDTFVLIAKLSPEDEKTFRESHSKVNKYLV